MSSASRYQATGFNEAAIGESRKEATSTYKNHRPMGFNEAAIGESRKARTDAVHYGPR